MRRFLKLLRSCGFAVLVSGVTAVSAADGPPQKADRTLQGDAVCTKCHDENWRKPILALYQTSMGVKGDPRTPGCQTCHGASDAHQKDPGGKKPDVEFEADSHNPVDEQNTVCLGCHASGKRTLWAGSQHQSHDLACVSCHEVHTKTGDRVLSKATQREVCFTCHKTQRAEILRISTHPLAAGKVACSDCHNPHGSEGPKLVAEKTVRDTCFTCHAEKRGPFLYEHPPASDDCMNCHTPHGSTNPPLLVARMPWLCQGCHGDGAPHPGNIYSGASLPGGAVANANTKNPILAGAINPVTGQSIALNNPPPQLAFRSCAGCHTQVHGSNHPAGERFVR